MGEITSENVSKIIKEINPQIQEQGTLKIIQTMKTTSRNIILKVLKMNDTEKKSKRSLRRKDSLLQSNETHS